MALPGIQPQSPRVLAWLLGGLLYRTLVALWLLPGFDEAYYYLYSRHLNWSYFDHPPLVAFTTGVGWWLTGQVSPFTIRLGALALYTLSLMLLYRAASRLYGLAAGHMTLAIVSLVPLLTIAFGILTSPDNGLMLAWSATLLVAIEEFFPPVVTAAAKAYRPSWRLALLGLLVGLACLSKYHGFILGLGLVGFCLTNRPYRSALTSPWTLAALGLFVLILFPLWYWNSQHQWISFRFQLGLRFEDSSGNSPFSWVQMVGYWLLSNLYLFPLFGFPLWWVLGRRTAGAIGHGSGLANAGLSTPVTSPADQSPYPLALILWLSWPIVLLFTLLGGKQQILPAWPAPGYWGAVILLGVQGVIWRRQRPAWVRRWLWGSGWFLATLSVLALLHLQLGVFQRPNHHTPWAGLVPVDQDGSTELIHTQQLRRLLAADPEVQEVLRETAFIFTNEYYLGGYIAMALPAPTDPPVTAFSQDPRGFAFWFDQGEWLGKDALWVTLERFVTDPEILNQYRPLFKAITPLTTLDLKRGGAVTETLHVFRCQEFRQIYPYPYGPAAEG